MPLDATQLGRDMAAAAAAVCGKRWPEIQSYMKTELEGLAHTLERIATRRATGRLSEESARALLNMQTESMKATLLAVEGLSRLMVEEALGAALGVVRGVVNTAVGFPLV